MLKTIEYEVGGTSYGSSTSYGSTRSQVDRGGGEATQRRSVDVEAHRVAGSGEGHDRVLPGFEGLFQSVSSQKHLLAVQKPLLSQLFRHRAMQFASDSQTVPSTVQACGGGGGQGGQKTLTPPHVTWPGSPTLQFASVVEHLTPRPVALQSAVVPSQQSTCALQDPSWDVVSTTDTGNPTSSVPKPAADGRPATEPSSAGSVAHRRSPAPATETSPRKRIQETRKVF